jgi:DNA-binding PadR family transcriptional regulator
MTVASCPGLPAGSRLHRLEDRGLIEAEWALSENSRKAKYYQLTAAARRQLRQESSALRRYTEAVFKVLEAEAS